MSIGLARLASRGSRAASRSRVSSASCGSSRPAAGARVGAEDPETAGVRQHGDPAAARQRLAREQHRDVGELLQRVGADHSRLLEESLDGGRRACECGRVRTGGALAGRRPSALHRQDRLLPRNAPRDPRELARVAERLQVEEDEIACSGRPPSTRAGRSRRRRPCCRRRRRPRGRDPARPPARAARDRARRSARRSRCCRRGRSEARRSRSGRPPRRRCRGSSARRDARRGRARGRAARPAGGRPRSRSRRSRRR